MDKGLIVSQYGEVTGEVLTICLKSVGNREAFRLENCGVGAEATYGNDLYDSRVRFILTIRASGLFISPGELTLSLST